MRTRWGLTVVGALAVSGCGQQPPGTSGPHPTTAAPAFNDADVTFARQMIPHHQGAIQMARIAQQRSTSQQVRDLAARIEQAAGSGGPDDDALASGLGRAGPHRRSGDDAAPAGHATSRGHLGMMGMSGPQFDRMFLQMMIAHHQGAVDMAKTEQARGLNPDARQLARSIETSQIAEIVQMRQMLGG